MKEINAQRAERLVNTYSDLILRLSYTYLKSTQDAEDICQTVLLKMGHPPGGVCLPALRGAGQL